MSKRELKQGDYVRTERMTEEQLQAVAKAFIDAGCPEKHPVPSLEMVQRYSRFGWAEGGHGLLRGDGAILLVGRELTIDQVLGTQEQPTIEQLLDKANRHAAKAAKHERKRSELVGRAKELVPEGWKLEEDRASKAVKAVDWTLTISKDMTDPANWKKGDVLERVAPDDQLAMGDRYTLIRANKKTLTAVNSDGFDVFSFIENFRWISRPQGESA